MESTPTAGENIAVLRKARGIGQTGLARQMSISVSYLSKIETGLRPATPTVVAAAARALHVTTARIHGLPFSEPSEHADLLTDLRAAVRRHTLPKEDTLPQAELARSLRHAAQLRADTDYLGLLRILPKLLGQTTATALDARGDAVAWCQLADVYGCAYAVAHRLAQPDLADMIVSRQQWAAQQTWNPSAEAAAAWNEAGTYQSAGQYDDGLAIIDRAVTQFRKSPADDVSAVIVLGSLHLRGVVLASRHRDKAATEAHLRHAHSLSERLEGDHVAHNLTFGSGNTALYELAARIELDQPQQAVRMGAPLADRPPSGLQPNRIGRFYIDLARALLATKNLDGAEGALKRAFHTSPQMAEIHPMSREVLRVLLVLHQRSKPDLLAMAAATGLAA